MGATEREIRTAAEVLLTGSASSQLQRHLPSYVHSSIINNEDLYVGFSNGNHMSIVRRFFCLLVTFDLLLTVLMWLMCMMLVNGDILSSLTSQVVHYNIKTSLFDIVLAALSRFTILMLFYALLHSSHWLAVAVSTAGTCGFLVAKVFVYNWATVNQPTFQVLLILVSFVLAWGETWFLDFRLLPQETKAKQFFLTSALHQEAERNPLVQNYISSLPGLSTNPESVVNFYSPLESPLEVDSGDEDNVSHRRISGARRAHVNAGVISDEDYIHRARELLHSAWELLNSPDWRVEKETPEGDVVHSKCVSGNPKLFRLTCKVGLPPKFLLEQLFDHIENMPSWNPTLIESRRIQSINSKVDITYQVTAPGGGGVVASRDFVILRHWDILDGVYISAGGSITHPSEPAKKRFIRGENGPGCWAMRPIEGDEHSCIFQWLLNTNLKGWLPQYVVDSAFTTAMFEYMKHLRAFADKLRQDGTLLDCQPIIQ